VPFFKSTYNILTAPWEDEVFDPNWMDSDKLVLPPNPSWDYAREMKIEDVDIWEVLYEQGGGTGVYAAWCPYAEFYMFRVNTGAGSQIETFYGKDAQKRLIEKLNLYKIPYSLHKTWVDPKDMWLYE
jgi:hypothetical protein